MAMLILLAFLIFFAVLGVPLAFAIGASCVTYITANAPTFMSMVPQLLYKGDLLLPGRGSPVSFWTS